MSMTDGRGATDRSSVARRPARKAMIVCAMVAAVALTAACRTPLLGGARSDAHGAKVERYVEREYGEALATSSVPPSVDVQLVDLNGSGTPEALVFIGSTGTCLRRGCRTAILDLSGPEARPIQDNVSAPSIVALESRTNGWLDIAYGTQRWAYRVPDGQYFRAGAL